MAVAGPRTVAVLMLACRALRYEHQLLAAAEGTVMTARSTLPPERALPQAVLYEMRHNLDPHPAEPYGSAEQTVTAADSIINRHHKTSVLKQGTGSGGIPERSVRWGHSSNLHNNCNTLQRRCSVRMSLLDPISAAE